MIKNEIAYWGVIRPQFLILGHFTRAKSDEAREWCVEHCMGRFISSDLYPWCFEIENDAIAFQNRYGGTIRFRDADSY